MVSKDIIDRIKRCEDQEEFVEIVAVERLSEDDIITVKRELLRWAIGNFKSPEEYDSSDHFMHPLVHLAILKEASELHGYLHETGYDHLSALFDRYNTAMHDYIDDNPNPILCTFVFFSVQDGMMTWLCNHLDIPKNSPGHYSIGKKQSVLAKQYRELIQEGDRVNSPFDTGDVIANLEEIWNHRNEIMHGGPRATFDMNIATVALLLVVITFEVLFEYRDIEPVEIPTDLISP